MSYTVLARRYRSQSFGQVVGQEPIARTLANAIAAGRTHHAYLFSGTRGVGKTSMARLFARALNAPDTVDDCPQPPDHDRYPPLDVQQRMAEAVMRGDDLNVIEIDAASNTGVDNVRDLIANATLAPTANARYKVYIIDEVHMLSKAAFNALLKIMEEPPSHVKFVLCTTEPEKVLPTIQSRCQRFDFRHIPTALIEQHLQQLLDAEGVKAEPGVTFELAKLGNGSMRDALSVLERMLATGEDPLTPKLLEQMLGLPDRELITRLVDAFVASDVAESLRLAEQLLSGGVGQEPFLTALIEHLRQLMLLRACGADCELVELDETSKKNLAEQARQFDAPALIHMIALCEHLQRSIRQSSVPRALLDAALARLALSEQFGDIAALASGLAKKKVTDAKPTPSRAIPKPQISNPQSEISVPASSAPVSDEHLWSAAVEAVGDKPALGWINDLELVDVKDHRITLRIKPHVRSRARFMQAQSPVLEQLFAEAAGRRVKVAIEAPVVTETAEAEPEPQARPRARRISQTEKDQAMQLPLVREVANMFDATLVDLRKDETSSES